MIFWQKKLNVQIQVGLYLFTHLWPFLHLDKNDDECSNTAKTSQHHADTMELQEIMTCEHISILIQSDSTIYTTNKSRTDYLKPMELSHS